MSKTKKRTRRTLVRDLRLRYWFPGIVLLIILFSALLRLRLQDTPLERDEGEYAYAGQLMLQGIPPYKLAYNMKLPGTYAVYSLILALFGQTPAGIHWGLLLVNATTTWLIWLLAARLFGSLAGVVAAASYALLSTSPSVLGFAAHATHFVVAAAIAGILLLLRAIESRRWFLFFCSGLLLGLSFLMKQPGIFFAIFAGLYLAGTEWKHFVDWRGALVRLASFTLGVCLPFALTCVILLRVGVFQEFWFWAFSYAREYGSSQTLADGMQNFLFIAPTVMGSTFLLWIVAGLGLVSPLFNRKAAAGAVFLLGLFVCSLLAVCLGLYFREHYFILILPAISVLAGVAVSSMSESLSELRFNRALSALPLAFFVFCFAYSLFQQREYLFELDPIAACRQTYGLNPFPEAIKIGEYLKSQMPESARLAVLGSEPEIYFYSDRHSATGYIYTYGLMEQQKYASTMRQQMIREVESAQPVFLVDVTVPASWNADVGSPQEVSFSSWAQKYVSEKYQLAGIVDLMGNQTQYLWGDDANGYKPRSSLFVRIFKRKGGAASQASQQPKTVADLP